MSRPIIAAASIADLQTVDVSGHTAGDLASVGNDYYSYAPDSLDAVVDGDVYYVANAAAANDPPTQPGRWKRVQAVGSGYRGYVFGEQRGVIANDATVDNAIVINALVREISAYGGGTLYLPPGVIYHSTPIEMIDDDEHGNVVNVTITGPANGAQTGVGSTALRYNGQGGANVAQILLYSRGCLIENLFLQTSAAISRNIDMTRASGTNAGVYTANTFRSLYVTGAGYGGSADYGVVIGDLVNGSYPLNGDYHEFDRVYFQNFDTACVYVPNDSGQIKAVVFDHCAFGFAPAGIYAERMGYECRACGFGHITDVAVYQGNASDPITFDGVVDVEWVAQFLRTGGPGGSFQVINIRNCRFDCTSGLRPDGRYLDIALPGPVSIESAMFQTVTPSNFHIRCNTAPHLPVAIKTDTVTFPDRVDGRFENLVQGSFNWNRINCNREDLERATVSLSDTPSTSVDQLGALSSGSQILITPWEVTKDVSNNISAVLNEADNADVITIEQALAIKQPLYVADDGDGYPTIDFGTTGKYLDVTGLTHESSGYDIFAVVKMNNLLDYQFLFGTNNGSGDANYWAVFLASGATAGNLGFFQNGVYVDGGAQLSTTDYQVVHWSLYKSNGGCIYINGTKLPASLNITVDHTIGTIVQISYNQAGTPMKAKLRELSIFGRTTPMNQKERLALTRQIAARNGGIVVA